MGIPFAREYEQIIDDLTKALLCVHECFEFLEMGREEWLELTEEERQDCIRTLADDLFYGLGSSPRMEAGGCTLVHDRDKHVIVVYHDAKLSSVVYLV